jgi:hypothetical protein
MSLYASPFGGFVTNRELRKEDLLICLSKIYEWCSLHRITEIVIRSFPNEYHPQSADLVKEAMLKFSFRILYTDISQFIQITTGGLLNMNADKKRRLRNSVARGFKFQSLPASCLNQAYELIVESRNNKGYPVSMSFESLRKMFILFPDEYLLFGILDGDKMIAASISIKVTEKILYCFYIGDHLGYRTHSPVTALVTGIHEYCKANNFWLLDLGLSTDKGSLNKGLFTFKKSFGAIESDKLTFVKKL